MKKESPRRMVVLSSLLVVSVGVSRLLMQSKANDASTLTIPTDRFTAVQNIQEVHLNPVVSPGTKISNKDKVGIMNDGGTVLGVGSVGENVDKNARVSTLNNTTLNEGSVIAGKGNKNASNTDTSLIVGGESNSIDPNGKNSVILGGQENRLFSQNSAILVSSGVHMEGNASFAAAVVSGHISGSGSSAYAGEDVVISSNGSLSMGSHIRLDQEGVFAFNTNDTPLSPTKPHTFVVNADHGMVVGTNDSPSKNVQLTVNGAIRLGDEACSLEKKGAIFSKKCSSPAEKSCLCACTGNGGGAVAISNDASCAKLCRGESTDCSFSAECGTRAITHEFGETNWRQFSAFCSGGVVVNGTEPSFPAPGSQVSWKCGNKDCIAKRKAEVPPCNKCGLKGFPYCFDVTFDPNAPECRDVVPASYKCIGVDFPNARLVAGDDQGLTADTAKKLVANNTTAKCEYLCNDYYTFHNGACVKLKLDFPIDPIDPNFPCEENPSCGSGGPCRCHKKWDPDPKNGGGRGYSKIDF